MYIIVIGSGRIGAGLARALEQRGHSLTVIDRDPTAFRRLGTEFKGRRLEGIGFDREVLIQAGIERADGLAAVANSDEANIVTAQLARQVFHVPKVVARVVDPVQAELYKRLGVNTISPKQWGIFQMVYELCLTQVDTVLSLGDGAVEIVEAEIPALLAGRQVTELTIAGEISVVAINRAGRVLIPTLGTVFQSGDHAFVAVASSARERLNSLLHLA